MYSKYVEADHCNSEVAISHIGGPTTVTLLQ